jgi:hypothetical protein
MRNSLFQTICLVLLIQFLCRAQETGQGDLALPLPDVAPAFAPVVAPPLLPVVQPAPSGVNWSGVFKDSFAFLVVEEGFRALTEKGARHTHEPFFQGWGSSVDGLHGWADGDPFLVNYVGHPMQGAVSGFLWIQNDRQYRHAEFGRDRQYWKGRLRAAAFSWAYSELSEIGPLSEATVGATQAKYPQQGFVDHVVTPTIGLAWIITEDALDKYVIKRLEGKTSNPYIKLVLRGGLNPSRSLANLLAGHVIWDRLTRPDVWPADSKYYVVKRNTGVDATATSTVKPSPESLPDVAPFEFSMIALAQGNTKGPGPCVGGGADIAARFTPHWQIVFEVAGCKMTGLPENHSGDTLQYMAGPRWTPSPGGRWSPYAQLLFGGQSVNREDVDAAKKAALEQTLRQSGGTISDEQHSLYATDYSANAIAFKAGAGLDLKLNSAFAFRIIGVDYMYSGVHRLDGTPHGQGMQVTGGMVLRLGTW